MIDLIPFDRNHFDALCSWFENESDVATWSGPAATFPLDVQQLEAIVNETRGVQPSRFAWSAICDTELIGHVQLAVDLRIGNATLQRVAIAPPHRGKGLARPMVGSVVERAFSLPQVVRLELLVFPFNEPAIRTYEALGFQHEGILRSSMPVGDERWDTCMMSLLRTDLPNPA